MENLIGYSGNTEKMIELSEGNRGAISALCSAYHACVLLHINYKEFLDYLKKQEIKGQFILLGFSDLCQKDAVLFIESTKNGTLRAQLKKNREWGYAHDEQETKDETTQ